MSAPWRQGTSPPAPNRISAMSSQLPTLTPPGAALSRWRARLAPLSSRAPSIFFPSSVAAAPTHSVSEKLSVFAFAAVVLAVIVGGAFAAGYLIGRILL